MSSTLQEAPVPSLVPAPRHIDPVDVYLVLTLALGDNPPPSFIFNTDTTPLYRNPYNVYVLEYPDGSRYAVQVPIRMRILPRAEIQDLIENEAANLEELAEAKFPYSPRLVTYSATYVNYLRFPYIIMTFIEGRPLEWTDLAPGPCERQWLFIQLAEIIYELTMCTLQHESDPAMTAERFLTDRVDTKIFQVIRKQRKDLSLQDCLFLRFLVKQISSIPNSLYPNTGEGVSNEPSNATATALAHDNLSAANILIDDEYNIKGLIGWSITKRLPLRFALKLPRLLTIQPNPYDTTMIHFMEVIDETAYPPTSLVWSRTFFAEALHTVILDRAPDSVLTRCAPLCMDATDLDWKHWALTSALSTSFHKWMRENGYMLFRTNLAKAFAADQRKKRDDYLKESLIGFCDRHLLDYATRARKRSALTAVGELFTGKKDWAWAETWLEVQFGKKP